MYKTMQFKCADQFNETAGAVGTNNSIAPTTMGANTALAQAWKHTSHVPQTDLFKS